VRTSARLLKHQALLTALMLILTGVFTAGCPPKAARVTVTEGDLRKANESSQEGDIAFTRKDYYAALIKYLEANRLNPNNEILLNRLGITYSLLKFYNEAAGAFQRAMEVNPKFPYAANNIGSVFFAQNNFRKAEKFFKKAISIKGDEASFHMNLGSLYLEQKKHSKALAEWRKGLVLDPDVFAKSSTVSLTGGGSSKSPMERYFFLARLFASAGKAEPALENLKLALIHGFSDIDAIENQPDFKPIREDPRFVEFMKNAPLLIKLRANVGLPEGTPVPAPNR